MLNCIIFLYEVQNLSSKFTAVCWNKDAMKWHALLQHNKKKYNGGYHNTQEKAAMAVNLMCDKLGIKRKNSEINITLDKKHVTEHIFYLNSREKSKF